MQELKIGIICAFIGSFIGFILGILYTEYKSRRDQLSILKLALINIQQEVGHNIAQLGKSLSLIRENICPFVISEMFEITAWNMALTTGAFRLYRNLDLLQKLSESYLGLENIMNLSRICTEYFYSTATAMTNFKTNFDGLSKHILELKQVALESLKQLAPILQKEIEKIS